MKTKNNKLTYLGHIKKDKEGKREVKKVYAKYKPNGDLSHFFYKEDNKEIEVKRSQCSDRDDIKDGRLRKQYDEEAKDFGHDFGYPNSYWE